MKPRRIGMLLSVVGAALALVAVLAPAASAKETAKGYERFAGCLSQEEDSEAFFCTRTTIDGGHFQMGSKDVPITQPMTLTGSPDIETGEILFNSKGGLSKAKQKVPGGVVGLTGLTFLLELLGSEALTLYAVTELVGTPKATGAGNNVELPIRVHLENSVLGKNCYVGSASNPIVLHMTVGTTSPPLPNKPITGVLPTEAASGLPEVTLLQNGTYVDNSFSAPGASGCVLTLFGFIPISINGLVNAQSGLPAAAGTNETKQNFDLEFTFQGTVYP